MSHSVGIDVGTSSAKLVLVGEEGAIERQCQVTYQVACPREGWREIDPEVWWRAVCEGLRSLLAGISPDQVGSIGVTGQMHTVVLVDGCGRSVRPALMWNDSRTQEDLVAARCRLRDAGDSYNASIISVGCPAMNLAWVRENEPDSLARTRSFLIGPDWIVFKLTGTIGTDYCEASTSSLFDMERRCWSESARKGFGLPAEIFPEVRGSGVVAGTVKEDVASAVGLPGLVPVIVGTGDNPAAAIPTGCLSQGKPVLSLGTSGVLMRRREHPDYRAKGKNILLSLDGHDCFTLVQGTVQSCGSAYSWWTRSILGIESFSGADAGIDPDALGGGDLLFYPHLEGEKTIYSDPTLRGAFFGLSVDVTRSQMTQAVMEGIAFGVRQLSDEMAFGLRSLDALQVVGGGSKSDVWMRILADILDVPTLRMRGESGAGYGIALLAQASTGESGPSALCVASLAVEKRFEPCDAAVSRYRTKYERYLRIHDAVTTLVQGE